MKNRFFVFSNLVWVFLATLDLACGNSGEAIKTAPLRPFQDLSGSIASQSGSQSDMAGWVVALIEKKTQVARLAEVDASGLFIFPHVYSDVEHTIALLSPSQILRSVLAHPIDNGLSVSQYFRFSASQGLPRLIHKGLTLSWQEIGPIVINKSNSVADIDGDGIPEGVYDSLTASETSLTLLNTDTDGDGENNITDSDLDGDGMINILDHNIDADVNADGMPLLNEFDTDSNGDLIKDTQQQKSRAYFGEEVQWVTLQYEILPTEIENQFTRHMTFIVKVEKSFLPSVSTVQVRRTPSLPLLDDATTNTSDAEGNTVLQPWDGTLLDDGLHEDGAAQDGLFSQRVNLKAGAAPSSNQVISFQVIFGSWAQEYLYVFPPVKPLEPKPSYSAIDRSIVFNSVEATKPFGINSDYVWLAVIYQVLEDGTNKKVYTSQPIVGSENTIVLPDNVVEPDKVYKYKVIAQSQDQVPGYAVFKIESRTLALE